MNRRRRKKLQRRLVAAAGWADVRRVVGLLRTGADPNLPDPDGTRPLYRASVQNAVSVRHAGSVRSVQIMQNEANAQIVPSVLVPKPARSNRATGAAVDVVAGATAEVGEMGKVVHVAMSAKRGWTRRARNL